MFPISWPEAMADFPDLSQKAFAYDQCILFLIE
jgi:hypothetical protein